MTSWTSALGLTEVPAIRGGTPLFDEPFRFIKPTLPPLDAVLRKYSDAYSHGLITNAGLVAQFEERCAERLGVKHCVAASSCTSGMMMVLRALDLEGEVILPSFTFFATGHAVLWNQLRPVFADCNPQTWTIDPDSVAEKITPRTAAILAVHMYGNPCGVEQLTHIAQQKGIRLIFDAAHGFGSSHRGIPVGQFGDAEVFSLSPTKLLVAGEGGLVTTNNSELAHKIRASRNYGDLGAYDPELLGLNARMSEFNAALGLAGLEVVNSKIRKHNEIASSYTELLSNVPGLTFQKIHPGDICTYKDYSVHVNPDLFGMSRDNLAEALRTENIETKKYFYPPLHRQKLYRRFCSSSSGDLRHTEWVSEGILSLPIYESLPPDTVEKVAVAIHRLAR